MKKLSDFKGLQNSELLELQGGLVSKNYVGGFVHTGYECFAGYVSDVFYDEDGNHEINSENEENSYISVIADPPRP